MYYRLNEGYWQTYTEPFFISHDGIWKIEYFSVDNANNVETVKAETLKIDQTQPTVTLFWDISGNRFTGYKVTWYAYADDTLSGMDRVDFDIEGVVQFSDYDEPYQWTVNWSNQFKKLPVKAIAYDNAGNFDWDVAGPPDSHSYYYPNLQWFCFRFPLFARILCLQLFLPELINLHNLL
jgi:hypothetical protein